jgi:hypothetical protein
MRYEINVARNGQHLFKTIKRSLTDESKAIELARELAEWLTYCDISVWCYEETERQIEWRAAEEEVPAEPPVTFTRKEAAVLRSLVEQLYAEPGFSDVSPEDLVTEAMDIHAVGGVLTALEKKDVLFVEELSPRYGYRGLGKNGEGVHLIYLTDLGEQFHARWAEEKGVECFPIITREN